MPDRVQAFGRRVIIVYRTVAVLLLNGLICFGCLELAATGIRSVRHSLGERDTTANSDPRASSSYFAFQDWARQYWQEFSASRRQSYRPFVVWRRAPFAGATINIDDSGVRSTPGALCNPESLKVFVLGGSTVWGTGSPDWATLPAYLQTELQQTTKQPVCVVNYGESAYVSTQSVLTLLLQLQSGNVPNLVLSYEGPNDVYSAYQSGIAGVHENLDQLVASFEGQRAVQDGAIVRFMRSTNLFALTAALLLKVTHPPEQPGKFVTYEAKGVGEDALTASVAKVYLGNYEIVDGLAQKFGFDFWFFWPPYIGIGSKPLAPEEQAIARRVDPALDVLYRSVHRAVAAAARTHPRLVDVTDVFDNCAGLIWLDDMHVTPEGNQLLAARIARAIEASSAFPLGRSRRGMP